MRRLIEDLLDVTSLEAGRLSVEVARVSAREVLTEAFEAGRPLAASASLELLQVFDNLLGNALKFTKPGGHVILGAAPGDDEVLFTVTDTGSGIAAEDLPHLFDRFWQARATDRRGAGLGLAIVKGVIEAHRGRIWVESTPGRGSTFFFAIPCEPQAAAGQPARTHDLGSS